MHTASKDSQMDHPPTLPVTNREESEVEILTYPVNFEPYQNHQYLRFLMRDWERENDGHKGAEKETTVGPRKRGRGAKIRNKPKRNAECKKKP
ncbi:hypothetical protein PGB90_005060 [Kerria lacca]